MKKGISTIQCISSYFATAFLFIAIAAIILLTNEKVAIHLAINGLHHGLADQFFKYVTHLGDGALTAIAVLPIGIFLFRKYRYSTLMLGWSSLAIAGGFAQFMKRVIFPHAERPIKFITEHTLHTIPGVELHSMHSFPSGHTATAFAFFAFLSMALFKNKRFMQLAMACLAIVVGYSRMYLSLHFLEDVVAGAFIGLVAYCLAHWLTSKIFKEGILK